MSNFFTLLPSNTVHNTIGNDFLATYEVICSLKRTVQGGKAVSLLEECIQILNQTYSQFDDLEAVGARLGKISDALRDLDDETYDTRTVTAVGDEENPQAQPGFIRKKAILDRITEAVGFAKQLAAESVKAAKTKAQQLAEGDEAKLEEAAEQVPDKLKPHFAGHARTLIWPNVGKTFRRGLPYRDAELEKPKKKSTQREDDESKGDLEEPLLGSGASSDAEPQGPSYKKPSFGQKFKQYFSQTTTNLVSLLFFAVNAFALLYYFSSFGLVSAITPVGWVLIGSAGLGLFSLLVGYPLYRGIIYLHKAYKAWKERLPRAEMTVTTADKDLYESRFQNCIMDVDDDPNVYLLKRKLWLLKGLIGQPNAKEKLEILLRELEGQDPDLLTHADLLRKASDVLAESKGDSDGEEALLDTGEPNDSVELDNLRSGQGNRNLALTPTSVFSDDDSPSSVARSSGRYQVSAQAELNLNFFIAAYNKLCGVQKGDPSAQLLHQVQSTIQILNKTYTEAELLGVRVLLADKLNALGEIAQANEEIGGGRLKPLSALAQSFAFASKKDRAKVRDEVGVLNRILNSILAEKGKPSSAPLETVKKTPAGGAKGDPLVEVQQPKTHLMPVSELIAVFEKKGMRHFLVAQGRWKKFSTYWTQPWQQFLASLFAIEGYAIGMVVFAKPIMGLLKISSGFLGLSGPVWLALGSVALVMLVMALAMLISWTRDVFWKKSTPSAVLTHARDRLGRFVTEAPHLEVVDDATARAKAGVFVGEKLLETANKLQADLDEKERNGEQPSAAEKLFVKRRLLEAKAMINGVTAEEATIVANATATLERIETLLANGAQPQEIQEEARFLKLTTSKVQLIDWTGDTALGRAKAIAKVATWEEVKIIAKVATAQEIQTLAGAASGGIWEQQATQDAIATIARRANGVSTTMGHVKHQLTRGGYGATDVSDFSSRVSRAEHPGDGAAQPAKAKAAVIPRSNSEQQIAALKEQIEAVKDEIRSTVNGAPAPDASRLEPAPEFTADGGGEDENDRENGLGAHHSYTPSVSKDNPYYVPPPAGANGTGDKSLSSTAAPALSRTWKERTNTVGGGAPTTPKQGAREQTSSAQERDRTRMVGEKPSRCVTM